MLNAADQRSAFYNAVALLIFAVAFTTLGSVLTSLFIGEQRANPGTITLNEDEWKCVVEKRNNAKPGCLLLRRLDFPFHHYALRDK